MSTKKMIAKIVMVAVIAGFCFWGCKKTDVSTVKPILTFKSISAYDVNQSNGSLSILLECNDITSLKSDTGVYVKLSLVNKISSCSTPGGGGTQTKTIYYPLPDISGATSYVSKIQINWTGISNGIPGNKCRPTDTTQIKIWVKNKAGLASDTLIVPNLVVIHNN